MLVAPNPIFEPAPQQIPRVYGIARPPDTLYEQVGEWLAQNPRPVQLPPPRRSTAQWIEWLRAEGFLEEIEGLGYWGDIGEFDA